MEPQVQGVLREHQVFRHQVVAVGKLRLLLTQSRDQTCFFFQTCQEKHLCIRSYPAVLVRRGLERVPPEDTKGLLVMLAAFYLYSALFLLLSSHTSPLTLMAPTERVLLGKAGT